MGEYSGREFCKDSKIKEKALLKNFVESDEDLENNFIPLEETDEFKAGVVDTFEPKDEKDDIPYKFETDFTPKDEDNISITKILPNLWDMKVKFMMTLKKALT